MPKYEITGWFTSSNVHHYRCVVEADDKEEAEQIAEECGENCDVPGAIAWEETDMDDCSYGTEASEIDSITEISELPAWVLGNDEADSSEMPG
jgi:hypothetical protein